MSKRIYTSRRKYTMADASTSTLEPLVRPYMELREIWPYAHRNGIVFCYRFDGALDVCSFGRQLPMAFKRGVYKYQKRLLTMLKEHDWRVCPARDAGHWKHWVYYRSLNKHVCLMCAQIGA